MNDQNKKIVIIAVVVIIVLILGVWLFRKVSSPGGRVSIPGGAGAPSNAPAGKPIGGGELYSGPETRTAVPSNVVVPGTTSTVPANVAKPQNVTAAAPGASASYRSFTISISGNAYNPNTIIVNQGDTFHITLTAVDKDYDFTQPDYGLHLEIPKGSTKLLEGQALQSGKFTFFCLACGGPTKGPVGYLTIVAK